MFLSELFKPGAKLLFSRSGGNRTLDPMIKSHVLCQLSYGPNVVTKLLKNKTFLHIIGVRILVCYAVTPRSILSQSKAGPISSFPDFL